MEYKGKLYGKVGGIVFDTGKTAEEWDAMEAKIMELEKEIAILREASSTITNLPGNLCNHNYNQVSTQWKKCSHCGMLAPL